MGTEFYKIKRKYILAAILKSAVLGLSLGATATGIALFSLKFTLRINPGYYVLIGLGIALISGGLFYLLFRPTDIKVAKKLDVEYGLNERVQTALAYRSDEGELAVLQREDAMARLASLKLRSPTVKELWQYIVIAALSLALFITAVAIPVKSDTKVPNLPPVVTEPNDSYEMTEFQAAAIEELIRDTRNSHLSASLKEEIGDALEELLEALKEAKVKAEMVNAISLSVAKVDASIKNEAAYYPIGKALLDGESKLLSKAVALGAEYYKRYTFATYKNLQDFYEVGPASVEDEISATIDELTTEVGALVAAGMSGELTVFINKIRAALDKKGDSVLKSVIEKFASSLDVDMTADELKTSIDNLTLGLCGALSSEAYMFSFGKYVASMLLSHFPIDQSAVSVSEWNLSALLGYDDDKGNGNNGGGYGEGKDVYGSDDIIYDPVTGEYVKYGEVLQKYYEIVQSFLNEGVLTDDQAAIVRAYFDLLFGGIKE